MKRSYLLYLLLFQLQILSSCDDDTDESACNGVTNISSNTACQSGNGLVLTAERDGPQVGIEWMIYAVKDSAAMGYTEKDIKIHAVTTTQITVPDSILKVYKTLIVTADVNCAGMIKHSIHYSFVPTGSSTGNCIIWKLNAPLN